HLLIELLKPRRSFRPSRLAICCNNSSRVTTFSVMRAYSASRTVWSEIFILPDTEAFLTTETEDESLAKSRLGWLTRPRSIQQCFSPAFAFQLSERPGLSFSALPCP